MQVSTSSVRREWTNYMDKAEYHYLEDNAAVESGRREMEETLLNWFVLILFFFVFLFFFIFSRYRTYVITYGTSVCTFYALGSFFLRNSVIFSVQKAKLGAQQWSNAQESLFNLEKSNVDSVDELVRLVTNAS